MQATASQSMGQSSIPLGGQSQSPYGDSSLSRRTSHAHGLPLRSTPNDTISAPSPTNISNGFAFPPPPIRPARRTAVIRTRRSSPLLHEIQGPSRRLSTHQMLLLTPFGGPLPMEAINPAIGTGMGMGRLTRGSSSMGGPNPSSGSGRAASLGMSSTPSSMGMGRNDTLNTSRGPPAPALSTRFNARHQSLIQPANPSPLSHPLTTIQSASDYGSESESSSLAISREPSNSSNTDEEPQIETEVHDRQSAARRINAMAVDMMRSNSLPVLTQREMDAMQDKDGELGIARGTHWAWVQDDDRDVPPDSPVPRTTPPGRPFAFQDPFAPLGTSAIHAGPSTRQMNPTTTSSDYHYSPTAEPRRMSDTTTWNHSNTSPGSQTVIESRGTSIATITLSSSAGNDSPSASASSPHSGSPSFPPVPAFNSRASMSALEQVPLLPLTGLELPSAPIRPRMLRYKTSPARFTGLGLHLVVKSQPSSSDASTATTSAPSRRRSSTKSIGIDQDRRRSSGTNSASSTESRRGTWAVVDVVDTLSSTSTAELSLPSTSTSTSTSTFPHTSTSSSLHSLRTIPDRNSVSSIYTVEHISSRSSPGNDKYRSLPTRKGKLPSAAFDTIAPVSMGIFNDPLAFPRRGSLAVLSQTALGPWASRQVAEPTAVGEELLGAPKGNWQDRRGSWAEGWSKTQV